MIPIRKKVEIFQDHDPAKLQKAINEWLAEGQLMDPEIHISSAPAIEIMDLKAVRITVLIAYSI